MLDSLSGKFLIYLNLYLFRRCDDWVPCSGRSHKVETSQIAKVQVVHEYKHVFVVPILDSIFPLGRIARLLNRLRVA